jgi:hypothetical protein
MKFERFKRGQLIQARWDVRRAHLDGVKQGTKGIVVQHHGALVDVIWLSKETNGQWPMHPARIQLIKEVQSG